ncbi:hypothetical protein [Parabacteroides sp. Marseille-P3160]|uniref:hypothetical protein n=1 Tax=Parabacteroides sp. Marseille-P3160 TaxID=1917887 RepID=UPI001119DEFE|nr:hypothetical protein [Parabacteroides sp. Marseille-P3160]
MERIVLEVDSSTASAWRKVPAEIKRQFIKETELRMKEHVRLAEQDEFKQALTNLRRQAAENGLTKEILEQLLHNEVY